MDPRPVLRSSHTRASSDRKMIIQRSACTWSVGLLRGSAQVKSTEPKFNRFASDHGPRPTRATAKNLQAIAQKEASREHIHPRIDHFDQVVTVYCGSFFNASGDRRLVGLYVKSHLTAESREVEKAKGAIFSLESAKAYAKTVYTAIAAEILNIVEHGELQISEHGEKYRRGYISVNGTKRYFVILLRENAKGEFCAAQVMTEQRFERRALPFAHEPGKGRVKKHSREKLVYVNSSHMSL